MDGGDASARSKVWVGKRGSPAVARLGPKNEWASCLVVKTLKDQGQVLLLADNGDEVTVAAHEVRLREGEYHPVTLSKEDAKQRAMRFTCHAAMTAQRFFRALLARREAGYMRAAVKAAIKPAGPAPITSRSQCAQAFSYLSALARIDSAPRPAPRRMTGS